MIKTKLISTFAGTLILCLLTSVSFAQFGLRMNYSQQRPINMSSVAPNAYGVTLGFHYRFEDTPFSIGIEGGLGFHNPNVQEVTLSQTPEIAQGTYYLSTLSMTSHYAVVPRIYLTNKGTFKPYISGRIGRMHHNTSFELNAPGMSTPDASSTSHDEECPEGTPAIAEGSVLRNAVWVVGGGIGARIDLVHDLIALNLEVNYIRGGVMRHLGPPEATVTPGTDLQVMGPQAPLLNHPYVNGRVHHSMTNMLDIRFGIFFSMP